MSFILPDFSTGLEKEHDMETKTTIIQIKNNLTEYINIFFEKKTLGQQRAILTIK
jgi:hypothetical protein